MAARFIKEDKFRVKITDRLVSVPAIVVFSLLAYFLDYVRFYAYVVLFALPVLPLDIAVKNSAGMNLGPFTFAAPATVMLVVGMVLLVRFLRTYPRQSREKANGKG